jgi:hypothetical protein
MRRDIGCDADQVSSWSEHPHKPFYCQYGIQSPAQEYEPRIERKPCCVWLVEWPVYKLFCLRSCVGTRRKSPKERAVGQQRLKVTQDAACNE